MYIDFITGYARYFITKKLARYFSKYRFEPAPVLDPRNFYFFSLPFYWAFKRKGEYFVFFSEKTKKEEIKILDKNGKVIANTSNNNYLTFPHPPQIKHNEYYIKVGNVSPKVLNIRLVSIKGTCNFRELGGYQTTQNQQLNWGLLFRSDYLADLDNTGKSMLEKKKINTVIDFRSTNETIKNPDKIPKGVKYLHLPIKQGKQESFIKKALLQGRGNELQGGQIMQDIYFSLAYDAQAQYTQFFKLLQKRENYPLVFHCTAGKDRTGFAAALLLAALGVDRNTILHDYLLSNFYRNHQNHKYAEMGKFFLKKEIINDFLIVKPTYLENALDDIEKKYGSISQYLIDVLGVDLKSQNAIKKIMLSPL